MRSIIFFLTIITICMIPVRYCFANLGEDNNQFICKENNIDYQKAQEFLNKFNDLVQASDKKNLAKMVNYPLEVYKIKKTGEKVNYNIEDEKDFLAQYHALFNEKAKVLLSNNHKVECYPLGYLCTALGDFCFNYSDEEIKISSIATIKDY